MFLRYLKLIAIAVITYFIFTGCEDTVVKIDEEDHLGEFIHHVEHEHFEGSKFDTITASVDTSNAPVLDSLGMVFRVIFTENNGFVKFSFTDTVSHERTLIIDQVVTAVVSQNGTPLEIEEEANLTNYSPEFIKMMNVYDMEPNVIYTIHITGITTIPDTVSIFMAPRGIEGDHDHER